MQRVCAANPNSRSIVAETACRRLANFPYLAHVISCEWIRQEIIEKPVEKWSLIAGWLAVSPCDWQTFQRNVQALEAALVRLSDLPEVLQSKIREKLRVHSDRAETRAVLAEISLAVFLSENHLSFDMEVRPRRGVSKDVDFSVELDGEPVFVEVQSLAESESSRHSSVISAAFGIAVGIDFEGEEERVIKKIYKKCSKLVEDEITLVALDCTAVPEHGGIGIGTIPDALDCIFMQDDAELTTEQQEIRLLVDGVIWFQLDISNALRPTMRGYALNKFSRHYESLVLRKWVNLWREQAFS